MYTLFMTDTKSIFTAASMRAAAIILVKLFQLITNKPAAIRTRYNQQ